VAVGEKPASREARIALEQAAPREGPSLMRPFAYARPQSLSEAYGLLATYDRHEVRMIVGGTDLIVGLQNGKLQPKLIIDLKHLNDLPPGIQESAGGLSISAPTTLSDILADERIRRRYPALVEAAQTVGSVQIRNRASLTGNICNASPAADTAPALLIYGAVVVLSGPAGQRRVTLDDFLLGARSTALGPDEIATAIELPTPAESLGTGFARLTRRRGVDLATLSVCCSVDARRTSFAFGAVGPRPFLVHDDSGLLADPTSTGSEREQLLQSITAHARPISDIRGGQDYRQAMLLVLSRRVLQAAISRRDAGPR
jgi:CO/xanthine dehydrogenase FAD-binding subunit